MLYGVRDVRDPNSSPDLAPVARSTEPWLSSHEMQTTYCTAGPHVRVLKPSFVWSSTTVPSRSPCFCCPVSAIQCHKVGHLEQQKSALCGSGGIFSASLCSGMPTSLSSPHLEASWLNLCLPFLAFGLLSVLKICPDVPR